jgi:hypothetical protein
MSDINITDDHLPAGVQQALIFVLEEIRTHVRNGQSSAKRQLDAASYLSPTDRDRVIQSLKNQLDHWKKADGLLDYILAMSSKKQRWIQAIRKMSERELVECGIAVELMEVMGWTVTPEVQTR